MTALLRMLPLVALLWACGAVAAAREGATLRRADGTEVPVTAYAPQGAACVGIAIISPGAGGSAEGYEYLGEALSSLGHLAVVVGHPESGRGALLQHVRGNGLRAGLGELITEPEAYRGRFMDIAAARQWAGSRCSAEQAILVGHSMGAATVMMEAGARNKIGIQGARSFAAYIALSPQGAGPIFPENAWTDIRQPVLMMTGTRDDELGGASWKTRTEPFAGMPAGCKWLGVIDGATHMNFAGNGRSRRTEALVRGTIGEFLQGIRRGDCRHRTTQRGIDVRTR